jgi:hypothetical protein
VHAYNACAVLCLLYVNPLKKSPPPLHATDNSTFTLYFKYFLRILCTFYLFNKYVLPPVFFILTRVVLLLITSTFTRVQIQSNLGTTGPPGHRKVSDFGINSSRSKIQIKL